MFRILLILALEIVMTSTSGAEGRLENIELIRPKKINYVPSPPAAGRPEIAKVRDSLATPRPKDVIPEPTLPRLKYGEMFALVRKDGTRPARDEEILDEPMLKYLKSVEGSKRDASGNLIAYDSPEGGTRTLGYGHKLAPGEKERTLSEEEAEQLLKEDAALAIQAARSFVNLKYGEATFENLSVRDQRSLVDMQFNLKGGLRTFPKFTEATVFGDHAKRLKEYKRHYTDKEGVVHVLKERNSAFYETFLADLPERIATEQKDAESRSS